MILVSEGVWEHDTTPDMVIEAFETKKAAEILG